MLRTVKWIAWYKNKYLKKKLSAKINLTPNIAQDTMNRNCICFSSAKSLQSGWYEIIAIFQMGVCEN